MTNIIYSLEQGILSPRDGTVNWLTHENYATLREAKAEGKKHTGRWRVIESKVVWTTEPLEQIP